MVWWGISFESHKRDESSCPELGLRQRLGLPPVSPAREPQGLPGADLVGGFSAGSHQATTRAESGEGLGS